MNLGLDGRIALVCGASRGIAFAVADILAREGTPLAIVSRNEEAVNKAADRLKASGARVLPVVADLSTVDGLEHTAKTVMSEYGRVDVLVTNTGGPQTGNAISHDWNAWTSASNLLLRSAVELTRSFVPGMQERKWGRVIGITSFAVKQPQPALVLSNSLRAAVTGYFRTLANEVAADNITVNTVLPGFTATERLDELAAATVKRTGISRDDVFDKWRAQTPARRIGDPEEVASVIAFLASERAGFLTGQAICVDGGAANSLL